MHDTNEILNARGEVERTAGLARQIVDLLQARGRYNVKTARRWIAHKACIPENTLKAYLQPSRWPKTFDVTVQRRLAWVWLKLCEKELAALERDIAVARALRRRGGVDQKHVDALAVASGELEAARERLEAVRAGLERL